MTRVSLLVGLRKSLAVDLKEKFGTGDRFRGDLGGRCAPNVIKERVRGKSSRQRPERESQKHYIKHLKVGLKK